MKVNVISLPYIFKVVYVLCFTRPRYQVSVYRTIGPLVIDSYLKFQSDFDIPSSNAGFLKEPIACLIANQNAAYSFDPRSFLIVSLIFDPDIISFVILALYMI